MIIDERHGKARPEEVDPARFELEQFLARTESNVALLALAGGNYARVRRSGDQKYPPFDWVEIGVSSSDRAETETLCRTSLDDAVKLLKKNGGVVRVYLPYE